MLKSYVTQDVFRALDAINQITHAYIYTCIHIDKHTNYV